MTNTYRALIASCCSITSRDMIKDIIGGDDLPATRQVYDGIAEYPWFVDTKYYTANVQLCETESRTIVNEEFANSIQAFVVVFDSSQKSSFENVKMWLPYLNELDPAVQILVCSRCTEDTELRRSSVIKWCLDHNFELVELDPVEADVDEDDFEESVGIKRITEALSYHSWPNLVLKEHADVRSQYFKGIMADAVAANKGKPDNTTKRKPTISCEPSNGGTDDTSKDAVASAKDKDAVGDNKDKSGNSAGPAASASKNTEEIIDSLLGDITSSAALTDGDDEDAFEQLFEKFQQMKAVADSIPPEQRKKYAEQVTIQFWKAIGADADEIEGLSSSDET